MIPDFADERINKKIAKFRANGAGRADYIIAPGIRLKIFVAADNYIELIFCDSNLKFARIEYIDNHILCNLYNRYYVSCVPSSKLLECLISISDDLAMWLLWNRIL